MKVRETASVAPRTVTEFSEGQHTRRRKSSQRTQSNLVIVTVDDRVMEVARNITAGDMKRIQIIDAETVIIHNNTAWKKR